VDPAARRTGPTWESDPGRKRARQARAGAARAGGDSPPEGGGCWRALEAEERGPVKTAALGSAGPRSGGASGPGPVDEGRDDVDDEEEAGRRSGGDGEDDGPDAAERDPDEERDRGEPERPALTAAPLRRAAAAGEPEGGADCERRRAIKTAQFSAL
jgi:hypothetical protein